MNRKLVLSLAFLSAAHSLVFGQDDVEVEAPATKVAEVPAYMNQFSNLTEEKRQRYAEHKIKAEQFFRQKRTFESLDEIHQALKIFEQDPGLWNLKGSCHVEFRSFSKAREAFQRALAIDEKNTGILFNLAEMDFVTKEWKDCVEKMTTLVQRLEESTDGEMEEATLNLHHLALFKILLSQLKLGQDDKARQLAEDNWEDWDDTPFTYYSKAALAYHEKDDEAANDWIMSAVRVFGGLENVANWQDTLIEYGYVKSFYGGDEGENIGDAGE